MMSEVVGSRTDICYLKTKIKIKIKCNTTTKLYACLVTPCLLVACLLAPSLACETAGLGL